MASEHQRISIKHLEDHEESELTLAPGKPLSLTASNSSGEIRVFASDRPTVAVRSTRIGRGGVDSFTRIEQIDNTIVVAVDNVQWMNIGDLGRSVVDLVKGTGQLRGIGSTGFDVEIELPREIAAHPQNRSKLSTASGEVTVTGLSGKLDVNTASGEITIEEGAAVLTANTASGEVTTTDVDGRITIRSASGDISVQRSQLEHLAVNTASGDVDVEATMAGRETSTLNTVSGDVNLRLTAPAARLTLSTVSGDSNVHAEFEKDGRGQWRLVPNNAAASSEGPTIAIKTVSGDISVHGTKGEAPVIDLPASTAPTKPVQFVPPAPSAPPAPPAPPTAAHFDNGGGQASQPTEPVDQVVEALDPESEAERMNVLQALERGEIDIDEAMSRLDAIEGQPAE
jgi:hypothetical protein